MLLLINYLHEKASQKVKTDEILTARALFVICTRVTWTFHPFSVHQRRVIFQSLPPYSVENKDYTEQNYSEDLMVMQSIIRRYLITFVTIVLFNGLSKEIPIFGGFLFLETLCILVFPNFLLTPTDNWLAQDRWRNNSYMQWPLRDTETGNRGPGLDHCRIGIPVPLPKELFLGLAY